MSPRTSISWAAPIIPLTKVKVDESSQRQSSSDCDKDDLHSQRLFMLKMQLMHLGKPLREWKNFENAISTRKHRYPRLALEFPLPDIHPVIYPFSDQKAACDVLVSNMLSKQSWKRRRRRFSRFYSLSRIGPISSFRYSSTWKEQILSPLYFIYCETAAPLIVLFLLIVFRMLIQMGIKLPGLSLVHFMASCFDSPPFLPPGENGYTKVFQGGDDVNLDDLEAELMTRNNISLSSERSPSVATISISYKHYANKGIVPGDDGRICRTDLHAIAQLIKVCAPCKLRFWIDTKLPPTNDRTFERWLTRGVRPYGRYITFLCPSAQKFAQTSFWLCNEYHIAVGVRGVMYFKGAHLYHETEHGSRINMRRRFLHIMIGAERHPVQVRQEDIGKVVCWAMRFLQEDNHSVAPVLDKVEGKSELFPLMHSIELLIKKFGSQELPIVPGKSWNENNPLILNGVPDQQHDLSMWFGLSLDESPDMVYFLPYSSFLLLEHKKSVVVLEVTLEQSHFSVGRIPVLRKVLREVSFSFIMRCRFVTVPWICEWE